MKEGRSQLDSCLQSISITAIEMMGEYKLPCLTFLEIISFRLLLYFHARAPLVAANSLFLMLTREFYTRESKATVQYFSIPFQDRCQLFTQVSLRCNSKHTLKTWGLSDPQLFRPSKDPLVAQLWHRNQVDCSACLDEEGYFTGNQADSGQDKHQKSFQSNLWTSQCRYP